MADRPSVSTQVLVGPSSSTQWVSSRSHGSTYGSFICKQANPPSVARTHRRAPLTLRLPHGEQLSPPMCSPEYTRRALRAGVVCVTTHVCIHAGVFTALGRKREGGTGDRVRPRGQGGTAGGHGGKEPVPPCIYPVLRAGAQPRVRQALPGSRRPICAGAQPVLEQDYGMGHMCGPQDPPCCVATDWGALGGLG